MIVDEPVEDADNLDDEMALENYLEASASAMRDAGSVKLPDWPAPAKQAGGLDLDVETLNWFKRSHADWRREIRSVLRAWVAAKTAKRETSQVSAFAAPASDCYGR
jgi:hypothetical protein